MTDDEWRRRDRIIQTVGYAIFYAVVVVGLWFVVRSINNTEVAPSNGGCHTEACVEGQYVQLDPPMGL